MNSVWPHLFQIIEGKFKGVSTEYPEEVYLRCQSWEYPYHWQIRHYFHQYLMLIILRSCWLVLHLPLFYTRATVSMCTGEQHVWFALQTDAALGHWVSLLRRLPHHLPQYHRCCQLIVSVTCSRLCCSCKLVLHGLVHLWNVLSYFIKI